MDKDDKFSEEQLNAFVDGELDNEDKSRVFNQSQQSQELNQRLCEKRKVKELVAYAYTDVPAPTPKTGPGKSRRIFWSKALAAGILLMVGVAIGSYAQYYIDHQRYGQESRVETLPSTKLSQPVVNGHKFILHVISGQREDMFSALQKAQELLDAAAPGQVNEVEVVANQRGLNLLRSDVTPFADEVQLLQENNVVFYACSRTIERLEEQGVAVELLPAANSTYTALDRVVIRMKDDWEYIRI